MTSVVSDVFENLEQFLGNKWCDNVVCYCS